MRQLGEDPEFSGLGCPTALPEGDPASSPLVSSHVRVVTGAVTRQVAVVSLQLTPRDYPHSRHLRSTLCLT